MLLSELLARYDVTQDDLVQRLGWRKEQAYSYWHGYIRVGRKVGLQLHETFGIPLEELFATGWVRPPWETDDRPSAASRAAP